MIFVELVVHIFKSVVPLSYISQSSGTPQSIALLFIILTREKVI